VKSPDAAGQDKEKPEGRSYADYLKKQGRSK
jgi:hypothetical protein